MSMLSVREVSVSFGGVFACSDVDIEVERGEIVGIIGPNGAGKTTLLNAISGLVPLNKGQILLDGSSISGQKPHRIAAAGLARTFQTSQLFPGMTVLENMMVGLHLNSHTGLFSAGFGTPKARAEERELADRAMEALRFVSMDRFADRAGNQLSFGQQRVIEIARSLIGDPKIVLLDEPAVGLSVNRVADLDRLLRRIPAEKGVTVVMIEHVLHLVMGVCDRVVVMNSGEKIADGPPKEIAKDQAVIEAYLGKQALAGS